MKVDPSSGTAIDDPLVIKALLLNYNLVLQEGNFYSNYKTEHSKMNKLMNKVAKID